MQQRRGSAFPVGLYFVLLAALCWLAVPGPFQVLERLLLGCACLPQRVHAALGAAPAHAAADDEQARVARLQDDLLARVRDADVRGARAALPAAWEPVSCRVVAIDGKGGAGLPSQLLLDRSYAELAGCRTMVTKGDALLGFLCAPGRGVAAADRPGDPARVQLLHDAQARTVAGALALPEGGVLRLLLRAAAPVDMAPLRVDLWDDPYRAAGLRAGGSEVRTLDLGSDGDGFAPPDLLIGHARIWGYERGDEALTIGVFVVPPFDVRALSHVVLWRSSGEPLAPTAAPGRRPGVLRALAGGRGRWHFTGSGPVAPGAAVVQGGLCIGTARPIGFGQALVTAFPASRQAWALLLLPDDPSLAVRELLGEVVAYDGTQAELAVTGGDAAGLAAGLLFTGSNGRLCPAGLLLGRCEPTPGSGRTLRVTTPALDDVVDAEAITAPGGS